MNLSKDQLQKIEHAGSIFLTIAEMAVFLNMEESVVRAEMAKRHSEFRTAYNRGKVGSIIELKEQEMKMAKMGAPVGLESVRVSKVEIELEDV